MQRLFVSCCPGVPDSQNIISYETAHERNYLEIRETPKRLIQDGIISLHRHRLWLGADEGNRVIYDATAETLTIGCYGRFVPEDSIRRRDDDEIIAAEPFNEPAE